MRIPVRASGRTFFLGFGLLFLLVGLGLLYGGVQQARQERAYRTEGRVVNAVVVGKSILRASREGNLSTRYEIAYRFTTDDGRAAEGVDVVGVEEWERLEPGSPFTVTYLPAAPDVSRAVGAGGMGASVAMMSMGGVLALAGGLVLGAAARRLWTERRLLREGTPAQGTVLAIEPSNVAVNRVRQWRVRYRYADHLARPHEGRSGLLPPEEAHAIRVGDTLDVRFDRARPDQSLLVQRLDVPGASAGGSAPSHERRPSLASRARRVAATLGVLVVALVAGESVPALKGLDRLAARHELALAAITIGMAAVGFALFMCGILYRLFGSDSEPITEAEVEDVSRNVGIDARPAAGRVSAYRVRGRTGGASFSDEFTLRQAGQAWRERAWRTSARWRANFIVTAGALLFTVGLFGFFVAGGPAGIKLLFVAAVLYVAVRMAIELARA